MSSLARQLELRHPHPEGTVTAQRPVGLDRDRAEVLADDCRVVTRGFDAHARPTAPRRRNARMRRRPMLPRGDHPEAVQPHHVVDTQRTR